MGWVAIWTWAAFGPTACYFWGREVGAYRMRRSMLRHPAFQRRSDTRKQFDQAA